MDRQRVQGGSAVDPKRSTHGTGRSHVAQGGIGGYDMDDEDDNVCIATFLYRGLSFPHRFRIFQYKRLTHTCGVGGHELDRSVGGRWWNDIRCECRLG